jgi:hypothetical protein
MSIRPALSIEDVSASMSDENAFPHERLAEEALIKFILAAAMSPADTASWAA